MNNSIRYARIILEQLIDETIDADSFYKYLCDYTDDDGTEVYTPSLNAISKIDKNELATEMADILYDRIVKIFKKNDDVAWNNARIEHDFKLAELEAMRNHQ